MEAYMKKQLLKFTVSKERKEKYSQLAKWLRENNIEHKKLPIGFQIDIRNIPPHLEDEFIKVATFGGD